MSINNEIDGAWFEVVEAFYFSTRNSFVLAGNILTGGIQEGMLFSLRDQGLDEVFRVDQISYMLKRVGLEYPALMLTVDEEMLGKLQAIDWDGQILELFYE